jgi:Clp amino terminal domain, pathogenicity island component
MEIELDELIAAVEETADTPLDRIEAAATLKDQLAGVGDDLLDHFVKLARDDGRSWTEIGDALGVTRQAAQQRHGGLLSRLLAGISGASGGLFTRFTPRARAAVSQAQVEARTRKHAQIGTEHVLLGLLPDEQSIAVRALRELDVDPEAVRRTVDERMPPGDTAVRGHIPFTGPAKKTLELALREALALGHNYIGTEHILLGLVRADAGGAEILAGHGVKSAALRRTVVRLVEAAKPG